MSHADKIILTFWIVVAGMACVFFYAVLTTRPLSPPARLVIAGAVGGLIGGVCVYIIKGVWGG